jgi:signal transduction histidine kinase
MEKKLSSQMLEVILEIPVKVMKLSRQELLTFLMQKIIEVLKVERVSIYEILEEAQCQLILGQPEGKHGIGSILSFSEFPYHAKVIQMKSPLQKKEPGLDPSIKRCKELIYTEGITAWLILPLLLENEVEWLMVVDAKWPRMEFSEEEIFFCIYLGDQVRLLLERERMQKILDENESIEEIRKITEEAVHRLRNPLLYIGGFARRFNNLTAKGIPCQDCKGKRYAERIMDGVLDLEKTLRGLLRFIQRKKMNLSQVDINETIVEIYRSLKESDQDKEIKLNLGDGLPRITADPEDIKDMISSILCNAVEAIQEKGEIRIKSGQENGCIRISISNNGSCIDEEVLQHIFDPFFTTKEGATGLGLAIAEEIARSYDGTIRVKDDRERNLTSFIIKLPYQ